MVNPGGLFEIVRLECRFHVFGSRLSGWQNERNHFWISFYDQGSSMSAFFLNSGKYMSCFIIWWILSCFSVLSLLKISFRHKHIYCLKFEIATSFVRKKIYVDRVQVTPANDCKTAVSYLSAIATTDIFEIRAIQIWRHRDHETFIKWVYFHWWKPTDNRLPVLIALSSFAKHSV